RFSNFNRRTRRMHAKQTLLRNINAYADYILQLQALDLEHVGWQFDNDRDDPSSTEGPSWFRRQDRSKGSKRGFNANRGPQHRGRRGSEFCWDDFEVETIFRSAFRGDRFFYWSFINEENPQWRNSSSNSNYGRTWSWRYRVEEEDYDDASTEDETSEPDLASDRRALGLKAYGPLKLEDVKTAYRACALKWHPDRHQGKSKAIAEEKFKLCGAAYQSLCDKLSVA
ncbi:DnaJ domain, partial [Dillenia turbinata]